MNLVTKYKEIISKIKVDNETSFIDWGKVTNVDLLFLESCNYKSLVKCFLKTFLFDVYDIEIKTKNNSNILLMNNPALRKDYSQAVENLYKYLDNADIIRLIYNRRINVLNLLRLKELKKIYCKLSEISDIKHRLFIIFKIIEYKHIGKKIINQIDKEKYSTFISLFDAAHIENFTTQFFNFNNKITVTLQHGQFRYSKENVGCEMNIWVENFISDYILVWGEHTKEEMLKASIKESRVKNVGFIKFIDNENIKYNIVNNNVFGILLDGGRDIRHNRNMIKIANKISVKLNKRYIIKCHPNFNNMKEYHDIIDFKYFNGEVDKDKNIYDYAKEVEFSLVHYSSVYTELLSMGHPTFKYNGMTNKLEKDSFCNEEQFYFKYNDYLLNKNNYLINSIRKSEYFLNKRVGTSSRYKKVINEISKN